MMEERLDVFRSAVFVKVFDQFPSWCAHAKVVHLSYMYNVLDVCCIQGSTVRTCTAVLRVDRDCFVSVEMAGQTIWLALVRAVQCIFVALQTVYLYVWICSSDFFFYTIWK